MEKPTVQHAIKLIEFVVSSIEMNNKRVFSKIDTESLDVKVSYDIGFNKEETHNYVVEFALEMENTDKQLVMKVLCSALFESNQEIDETFMTSAFVNENSPAIAFPFLRSFVNTLTSSCGLSPIILPAFNFSSSN